MNLTERQIEDLTDLHEGALLVHQRSEDQWYVYAEGTTANRVEESDAHLYLGQGWVERQGFESSLNLELYALTDAGYEALEPFLEEDEVTDEDGAPRLLLPVTDAGTSYVVAVPVNPYDVEATRRRFVLAETLAAADDAFVSLEYESDLVVLDPNRSEELAELLTRGNSYALVSALSEAWQEEAGVGLEWASMLVSEEGVSFAVGLPDGLRLETDELAEEDLMAVALTLLGGDAPRTTA